MQTSPAVRAIRGGLLAFLRSCPVGEGQPSAAWADRCVAPSSGALCRSSTGGMPAWQGPGLRCGLGGPRWEAAGVGGPYPYVVCVLLGLIRAH